MIFWRYILDRSFLEQLGWTLVHFLWQAAALVIAYEILRRLSRRASSRTRYALACFTLLIMALAPVGTFFYLADPLPDPGPLILPGRGVPLTTLTGILSALRSSLPWLVRIWLVGAALVLLVKIGAFVALNGLIHRRVATLDHEVHERFEQLRERMRIRRRVRYVVSTLFESPATLGWLRPIVLIPAAALTGLPPDQLDAVIAHELAHIRRHDYLVNMLQTAMETILFFHPAVWWVSKRVREERENCCDDLVLAVYGDRGAYAHALAAIDDLPPLPSSLAMPAGGGTLLLRINRILEGAPFGTARAGIVAVFTWVIVIALLFSICESAVVGSVSAIPRAPRDMSSVRAAVLTTLGIKSPAGTYLVELQTAVAGFDGKSRPDDEAVNALVDSVTSHPNPDNFATLLISRESLADAKSRRQINWNYGTATGRQQLIKYMWNKAIEMEPAKPGMARRYARSALILGSAEDFILEAACVYPLLRQPQFQAIAGIPTNKLRRLQGYLRDHQAISSASIQLRLQVDATIDEIASTKEPSQRQEKVREALSNLRTLVMLAHQRPDVQWKVANLQARLLVAGGPEAKAPIIAASKEWCALCPEPRLSLWLQQVSMNLDPLAIRHVRRVTDADMAKLRKN
jgi:beta-lactamase regulating signal transducer with metallopeptidase domain